MVLFSFLKVSYKWKKLLRSSQLVSVQCTTVHCSNVRTWRAGSTWCTWWSSITGSTVVKCRGFPTTAKVKKWLCNCFPRISISAIGYPLLSYLTLVYGGLVYNTTFKVFAARSGLLHWKRFPPPDITWYCESYWWIAVTLNRHFILLLPTPPLEDIKFHQEMAIQCDDAAFESCSPGVSDSWYSHPGNGTVDLSWRCMRLYDLQPEILSKWFIKNYLSLNKKSIPVCQHISTSHKLHGSEILQNQRPTLQVG